MKLPELARADDLGVADRSALETTGVSCAYGGVQAVDSVSFKIRPGDCVGLIGPNGAGKSTLLDNIAGFNLDYKGRVHLFETDVTSWPMHRRAQLGVARAFQAPRMFGRMTVLSNMMVAPQRQAGEKFFRAVLGTWRSAESQHLQKAKQLLNRFSLASVANSYASELSGGQERLLELARAMMTEPQLLLLDEPFAGVSPANRRHLVQHLHDLSTSEGVTILMVEHRLAWVKELCGRVVVMAQGRIIADGSLEEVTREREVIDAYFGRRAS